MKTTPQQPKGSTSTNPTGNWDKSPQKPKIPTPTNPTENREKSLQKPEGPENSIPITYQWLQKSLSFTQTGNVVSLLERKLGGTTDEGGDHDSEQ